MTIQDLHHRYAIGSLTAGGFATWVMLLVEEESVGVFLASLPEEVLKLVREFVENYEPGRTVLFGGAQDPGLERVLFMRQWFHQHEMPPPK